MELLRLYEELNRYENSLSDSFVVVTVCIGVSRASGVTAP